MRVLAFLSLLAVIGTAHADPLATRLTVTAEARVERAPEIAQITAGVVSTAPTATEAAHANAEAMAHVIAAVRAARVPDRDVQTVALTLQPQYNYQNGQSPRLTGYQASNSVSVRLRDLPRAGAVVDALVAAGANQIGGPTFMVADEDAATDAARTAAVAKARARADLYARAMGLRVVRILRASEGGELPEPRPMRARMMLASAAAEASAPVAPGEIALSASVTIEFELIGWRTACPPPYGFHAAAPGVIC